MKNELKLKWRVTFYRFPEYRLVFITKRPKRKTKLIDHFHKK